MVIIDEPTRGIDIGNKSQIYRFIQDLVASGKGCIVISSELQELIGVCDRVLVMRAGSIAAELTGDAITEHNVVLAATSSHQPAPVPVETVGMSETAVPVPRAARGFRLNWVDAGPFLALAVLLGVGVLINPDFLTLTNIANVVTRSAFIAIIAVGATFVISAGGLDLSVGAMAAFVTGIMIMFMNHLVPILGVWSIAAGMVMVVGAGALCGLVNGLIVAVGKIEPFIATLGTMGIFRALITFLADGGTIPIDRSLRDPYRPAYFGTLIGIPIPIWVSLAVAGIGALILYKTKFGRRCGAVGANEDVARFSGVSVAGVRVATYVIQGVCVAIAAICYVPRLGAATPTTGLLVGAAGDHVGGHRRHRAARRQGQDLGHHRGRRDPRTHRQPDGACRTSSPSTSWRRCRASSSSSPC